MCCYLNIIYCLNASFKVSTTHTYYSRNWHLGYGLNVQRDFSFALTVRCLRPIGLPRYKMVPRVGIAPTQPRGLLIYSQNHVFSGITRQLKTTNHTFLQDPNYLHNFVKKDLNLYFEDLTSFFSQLFYK